MLETIALAKKLKKCFNAPLSSAGPAIIRRVRWTEKNYHRFIREKSC